VQSNRTGDRVRQVRVRQVARDSPVTVVCADGTRIGADAVVVTVSLGVLKSSMIQFDPELPAEKTTAISRLGFGLLNKANHESLGNL